MSAEFWAILGVGVVLVGLHWRTLARIDVLQSGTATVKERLTAVEATLALIVKGLHIKVSGKGGSP